MVIKTNDAQTAHILWLPSMSQSQVLYATCLRRFQRLRLLLLSFKARSLCKVVAMPWVTVKGKTITTVCFVSAPLSKRTRERTSSFWTEMQDFCHRSRRSHMREYAIMDCGHFAVTELISRVKHSLRKYIKSNYVSFLPNFRGCWYSLHKLK